MREYLPFLQANLLYILSFLLTAVSFYCLGLLSRRRPLVQILPSPAISTAPQVSLGPDPYTLGYVDAASNSERSFAHPN